MDDPCRKHSGEADGLHREVLNVSRTMTAPVNRLLTVRQYSGRSSADYCFISSPHRPMKHSFTLGAVSGITALAIGFPFAAQHVGAREVSSMLSAKSTERGFFRGHAPLSQDEVHEMVNHDNQFLLHIDALVAIQKRAIQNHRIALQAAADIADETERKAAVNAAHEAMRTEVQTAIKADPELKDLKMPFGQKGLHSGPKGGHGKGPKGHGGEKFHERRGGMPEAASN